MACPRRVDTGTRQIAEALGGDLSGEDARVDAICMAIHGHDENLQMEHWHQVARRFIVGACFQHWAGGRRGEPVGKSNFHLAVPGLAPPPDRFLGSIFGPIRENQGDYIFQN